MRLDEIELAGRALGERLSRYRGAGSLILALPPGGVPIAIVLADSISGDVDIVQAEGVVAGDYLGAVAETGQVVLTSGGAGTEACEALFAGRIGEQISRMLECRVRCLPEVAIPDVSGRVVIVVADGLATGARMKAALTSLRFRGAARLVAVAAAGTDRSVEAIRLLADEIVCLSIQSTIAGVGRALKGWRHLPEHEAFRMLRKKLRVQQSAHCAQA